MVVGKGCRGGSCLSVSRRSLRKHASVDRKPPNRSTPALQIPRDLQMGSRCLRRKDLESHVSYFFVKRMFS